MAKEVINSGRFSRPITPGTTSPVVTARPPSSSLTQPPVQRKRFKDSLELRHARVVELET